MPEVEMPEVEGRGKDGGRPTFCRFPDRHFGTPDNKYPNWRTYFNSTILQQLTQTSKYNS